MGDLIAARPIPRGLHMAGEVETGAVHRLDRSSTAPTIPPPICRLGIPLKYLKPLTGMSGYAFAATREDAETRRQR